MKYKAAVHPAGAQVGQNVANVKGQVGIGYEKGAQPGHEGAVKGVDAADDQKQEKFFCQKMMLGFFN